MTDRAPYCSRLATSVRQVGRIKEELCPTALGTGRSWFLLSSDCDGSRLSGTLRGQLLKKTCLPCRTLVASLYWRYAQICKHAAASLHLSVCTCPAASSLAAVCAPVSLGLRVWGKVCLSPQRLSMSGPRRRMCTQQQCKLLLLMYGVMRACTDGVSGSWAPPAAW